MFKLKKQIVSLNELNDAAANQPDFLKYKDPLQLLQPNDLENCLAELRRLKKENHSLIDERSLL